MRRLEGRKRGEKVFYGEEKERREGVHWRGDREERRCTMEGRESGEKVFY